MTTGIEKAHTSCLCVNKHWVLHILATASQSDMSLESFASHKNQNVIKLKYSAIPLLRNKRCPSGSYYVDPHINTNQMRITFYGIKYKINISSNG